MHIHVSTNELIKKTRFYQTIALSQIFQRPLHLRRSTKDKIVRNIWRISIKRADTLAYEVQSMQRTVLVKTFVTKRRSSVQIWLSEFLKIWIYERYLTQLPRYIVLVARFSFSYDISVNRDSLIDTHSSLAFPSNAAYNVVFANEPLRWIGQTFIRSFLHLPFYCVHCFWHGDAEHSQFTTPIILTAGHSANPFPIPMSGRCPCTPFSAHPTLSPP